MNDSAVAAFVVKLTGRCNLNCKYCYVYNLADSTWKIQPKVMSEVSLQLLGDRIREHIVSHKLKEIAVVLHGGEPLLLGAERLDRYLSLFWQALAGINIEVNLGMQTNGLLLNTEIGAVLAKHHATFGVSIDGIPGKGDLERVDHKGVPSGTKLEKVLKEFLASPYRTQFTGFIAVANIEQDPRDTLKYLASYNPPSIDFRFPLNHHSNLPRRMDKTPGSAEYGRWYAEILDELLSSRKKISVRFLSAIAQGLTGQTLGDLYLGNSEIEIAVIESDGSYELVDNLKSIGNGLTKTGLNLRDHSLDEFVAFRNAWIQREHLNEAPAECRRCPLFNACRGCYYMSRYAEGSGFGNRSVYCNDMKHFIPIMHARLVTA